MLSKILLIFALCVSICVSQPDDLFGALWIQCPASTFEPSYPPITVTRAGISTLLKVELGAGLVPEDVVETNKKILEFRSPLFQLPSLILLSFGVGGVPFGIDEGFSPVLPDENCNSTACYGKSYLETAADSLGNFESRSNRGTVGWLAPTSDKNAMALEALKAALDAPITNPELTSDSIPVIRMLSPDQFGILIESDMIVTFNRSDECSEILFEDLLQIFRLIANMETFLAASDKPQVLFLSLHRGVVCHAENMFTTAASVAVQGSLEMLTAVANAYTSGLAFSVAEHLSIAQYQALLAAAVRDNGNHHPVPNEQAAANDEQAAADFIVNSRRRRLQESSPANPFPLRKQMVLWLSIVLVIALVLAILPLFALSFMNDPSLATKLNTAQHS